MTYAVIIAVVLAVLAIYLLSWKKAAYNNIRVQDGDSVIIRHKGNDYTCRVVGYDAPEWNQIHGREAASALRTMLFAGARWRITGTDAYGRHLIKLRNSKGSIGRQMVVAGHAHNRARWYVEQFFAQMLRRGLWGNAQRLCPTTFRALNK